MSGIFEDYKPFRNRLRKLKLLESLEVVHAYATHLCYQAQLPSTVEVPRSFVRARHWHEKNVLPWELETLTSELLINAPEHTLPRASLRAWSYFSSTINRIKDLDAAIVREYGSLYRDQVLHELFRMAHRQFPWQVRGTKDQMIRYLRLYNHPVLRDAVVSIVGLTTDELFTIGIALNGHYLKRFTAPLPLTHRGLHAITAAKLETFLGLFSTSLDTIRQEVTAGQCLNENYFYTFNPLRARPLIVVGDPSAQELACPLPPLLLNAFTDGLYYRLVSTQGVPEALGSAFQQHIGDVLEAANTGGLLSVLPETEYRVGRNRKDTVDWVVRDRTAVLFTEVKTKRIRWEAHERLSSDDVLQEELAKMASFVVQLYATLADFKEGRYPDEFGVAPETIYPIIVTLEDWHMFGDPVWKSFPTMIEEKFSAVGLNPQLLEQHPYIISSVDEFEELAQRVAHEGIDSVLGLKIGDPERRAWPLGAFFQNQPSPHPQRQLFEADFDAFLGRVRRHQ